MPDLSAFGGALGPILGAAIALIGTTITLRHQLSLERLKNDLLVRNARHDRLRETYETVLLGAGAIDLAARRLVLQLRDGTPESRKAIADMLEASTMDLVHAGVRLHLDPDATSVVGAFEQVRVKWVEFQVALGLLQSEWASPDRPRLIAQVIEDRKALEDLVERLHQDMLESLTHMDGPGGKLGPSRNWLTFWRR